MSEFLNLLIYYRHSSVENGEKKIDVKRMKPDDPIFKILSACILRTLKMLHKDLAIYAMIALANHIREANPKAKLPKDTESWVENEFLPLLKHEFPVVCVDDELNIHDAIGLVQSKTYNPDGWHKSIVVQLSTLWMRRLLDFARDNDREDYKRVVLSVITTLFHEVGGHVLRIMYTAGQNIKTPVGVVAPTTRQKWESASLNLSKRGESGRFIEYEALSGEVRQRSFNAGAEMNLLRKPFDDPKRPGEARATDYFISDKTMNCILGVDGQGQSSIVTSLRDIPFPKLTSLIDVKLPYVDGDAQRNNFPLDRDDGPRQKPPLDHQSNRRRNPRPLLRREDARPNQIDTGEGAEIHRYTYEPELLEPSNPPKLGEPIKLEDPPKGKRKHHRSSHEKKGKKNDCIVS